MCAHAQEFKYRYLRPDGKLEERCRICRGHHQYNYLRRKKEKVINEAAWRELSFRKWRDE